MRRFRLGIECNTGRDIEDVLDLVLINPNELLLYLSNGLKPMVELEYPFRVCIDVISKLMICINAQL